MVRKFIEHTQATYTIDRNRIVVHGRQVSGGMAWLTAIAHRNLIRGIAVVDAPLPERVEPGNDPVNRLFVWSCVAKNYAKREAIEAGHARLKAAKVPLVVLSQDAARDLNDDEQLQFARWIDSLDRL